MKAASYLTLFLFIIIFGCSSDHFENIKAKYTEEITKFTDYIEDYPIEQDTSIITDTIEAKKLYNELAAYLSKDSLFEVWANSEDVAELNVNHIYIAGQSYQTEIFPVIAKQLSPEKLEYLTKYIPRKAGGYSIELKKNNTFSTILEISVFQFTNSPEYYFKDKEGYIRFELKHTRRLPKEVTNDSTGSESAEYFRMMVWVSKEKR